MNTSFSGSQVKKLVATPPLPFKRNQHGHYLIQVVGLDLTGAAEIERGTRRGTRFGDLARQCLLSDRPDSYDAKHRLEQGRAYTLALVPGKAIQNPWRPTVDIQAYGLGLGYQKPLGGHVVRARELVTDDQIKAMGFNFIAGLHDPITVSVGRPLFFFANRGDDSSWLGADGVGPGVGWIDAGAFLFVLTE